MRVSSQTPVMDSNNLNPAKNGMMNTTSSENSLRQLMKTQQSENEGNAVPKEKVQKAIDALNEFIHLQNHTSKFVMHEGLEKYYVQVVDAKTEEVIREIPPKKLLDAFYTMQKFLGMIVDEKI